MFMVDAANLVLRRRSPAPWAVEKIPGGFKVLDANGQSLAICLLE
jgi:hypothetical protein